VKRTVPLRIGRLGARVLGSVVLAFLVLSVSCSELFAQPADSARARSVVRGWLKSHPRPLGAALGRQVGRIETFNGDDGEAIYHMVALQDGGYVIVPADDCIEPILCFVETGSYDPSRAKPLAALVNRDVPARIAAARAAQTPAGGSIQLQGFTLADTALLEAIGEAQDKWDRLAAAETSVSIMSLPAVPDRRVGPLLQSQWGQTTIGSYINGTSCYNYYTPPYDPGDPCNHPVGCIATAMAQLMRYHEHPAGQYVWSGMPLRPDSSTSLAQRKAIGWFCFQVAESIETNYGEGGSSASLDKGGLELRETFGYGNSIIARDPAIGSTFNTMANTNLDAGLPVLLGFDGVGGGHAVVCDGYGYDSATIYHHLNMGWTGHDDAWYALPTADTYIYLYAVHTCVYNIFPTGSGEVVSGRAIDAAGNPIQDVQVAATPSGSAARYTTTNAQGIYAFANLPSNRYITLKATKAPHVFSNRAVSTGRSSDYGGAGNVWGVDFMSLANMPPTAYDSSASVTAGAARPIALLAEDDGKPNPPGRISYKITALPLHGSLTDPIAGQITAVPYTLADYGNVVYYQSCSYYGGHDELYFVANDGGVPPEGGDSEPAVVTIDVNNVAYTAYAPQTNLVAPFPIQTSRHDSRTQVVYMSNAIGGDKTITALALDIRTPPSQNLEQWTIRMKHTTRTGYYSRPYFETTGWTTVYSAYVAKPSTGWQRFDFTSPFEYNGDDNLMIDFSHDNSRATVNASCRVSETGAPRVMISVANSEYGRPVDWQDGYPPGYSLATAVPNIKLSSTIGGPPVPGDFQLDCKVNEIDLGVLSNAWLSGIGDPGWDPACDIGGNDNVINELDFAEFAQRWRHIAN